MVDFNDGNTIGTPAVDIFRVEALQAQANAFEAYEEYCKVKFKGGTGEGSILKARLITWFLIHQPYLKRSKHPEYTVLEVELLVIEQSTAEDILKCMIILNEVLDKLNITVLDTRKVYDHTNWETDNKEQGLG